MLVWFLSIIMRIRFVMEKKIQTSESLKIALILAFTGGFFDIYTYMVRGKVFANAQTGNMVLFGLKIAEGDISGILYYAVPLVACIVGVILAFYIKYYFKEHNQIHWRQIILIIEAAAVVLVAFIPRGEYDSVVNAVISFVCSVQMQSFRKLKGGPLATNMCTGNLRSAVDFGLQYLQNKDSKIAAKCKDYFTVVLVFIVGAIAGGILVKATDYVAVAFTAIPLILAAVAMKKEEV